MGRALLAVTAALLGWVVGCGSPPSEVAVLSNEVVYGSDDRMELFEADELQRALGASVVALGLRSELTEDAGGLPSVSSPSWRERAGLCEGERFAEQPSFALCTGIAIGTDLVLTAAHCLRTAKLGELAVVTGFAFEAPQQLRMARDGQVHAIESLLASDSYWDYAWLRVEAGLLPLAPERRAASDVSAAAGVFSINHGAGLPAKVDSGGTAYWLSAHELLTTLDTFGGASGGPVFSSAGNLVGVLTAGSDDYELTGAGCFTVARRPDVPEAANELVVGLRKPMDAICEVSPGDPALADACGEPSAARQRSLREGGCAITLPSASPSGWPWGLIALCLVARRRRH